MSKNNTFVPVTPTAHILRAQPKDCIELIFSDGRTLVCTPDHQVMTTSGWKRADELIARESRVIAGPDAPLYDPAEDDPAHLLAFTINLPNVGVRNPF